MILTQEGRKGLCEKRLCLFTFISGGREGVIRSCLDSSGFHLFFYELGDVGVKRGEALDRERGRMLVKDLANAVRQCHHAVLGIAAHSLQQDQIPALVELYNPLVMEFQDIADVVFVSLGSQAHSELRIALDARHLDVRILSHEELKASGEDSV